MIRVRIQDSTKEIKNNNILLLPNQQIT